MDFYGDQWRVHAKLGAAVYGSEGHVFILEGGAIL
jgi:hypothetical protein